MSKHNQPLFPELPDNIKRLLIITSLLFEVRYNQAIPKAVYARLENLYIKIWKMIIDKE